MRAARLALQRPEAAEAGLAHVQLGLDRLPPCRLIPSSATAEERPHGSLRNLIPRSLQSRLNKPEQVPDQRWGQDHTNLCLQRGSCGVSVVDTENVIDNHMGVPCGAALDSSVDTINIA